MSQSGHPFLLHLSPECFFVSLVISCCRLLSSVTRTALTYPSLSALLWFEALYISTGSRLDSDDGVEWHVVHDEQPARVCIISSEPLSYDEAVSDTVAPTGAPDTPNLDFFSLTAHLFPDT